MVPIKTPTDREEDPYPRQKHQKSLWIEEGGGRARSVSCEVGISVRTPESDGPEMDAADKDKEEEEEEEEEAKSEMDTTFAASVRSVR